MSRTADKDNIAEPAPSEPIDGYQRRRARTRERMLDAAELLVVAEGTEFSMLELAEHAEVSPATPFNHFDTKLGVFAALVERSLHEVAQPLAGLTSEVHPVDGILDYTDYVTSYYADRREIYAPTLGAVLGFVSFDNPIIQRATSMWRSGLEAIDAIGELSDGVDLELLARHLETSWIGSLLPWCSGSIDGQAWRTQVRFGTALSLSACTTGEAQRLAQAALHLQCRA